MYIKAINPSNLVVIIFDYDEWGPGRTFQRSLIDQALILIFLSPLDWLSDAPHDVMFPT